jgi:hypothetical protein
MSSSQLLLLAVVALALYGVGQVWLVQVSSYRLWRLVGNEDFAAYHAAWWRSIWIVILVPAAFVTIGAFLMPWRLAPGVPAWSAWLGCGLQAIVVLGTAAWWGPLMARLETPSDTLSLERYELLMRTHWVRVALITAYGALAVWMLAVSAFDKRA